MKLIVNMMALVLLSLLAGCAGFGIDEDKRYAAWKDVRVAEEKTEQEFLKTKQAEAKNKPQIIIDTKDEMRDYAIVVMAEALAGKGKGTDTYGVDLRATPPPKDVWAERIEATGKAAKDIAQTPAAMVLSTGIAIGQAVGDGVRGDSYVAEGDVNVNGSHNRQVAAVGGDGTVAFGDPAGSSSGSTDDHSITDGEGTDETPDEEAAPEEELPSVEE